MHLQPTGTYRNILFSFKCVNEKLEIVQTRLEVQLAFCVVYLADWLGFFFECRVVVHWAF